MDDIIVDDCDSSNSEMNITSAGSSISLLVLNIFLRPPLISNNGNDYKDLRADYFAKNIMHKYDIVSLQEAFYSFNSRISKLTKIAKSKGYDSYNIKGKFFGLSIDSADNPTEHKGDRAYTRVKSTLASNIFARSASVSSPEYSGASGTSILYRATMMHSTTTASVSENLQQRHPHQLDDPRITSV